MRRRPSMSTSRTSVGCGSAATFSIRGGWAILAAASIASPAHAGPEQCAAAITECGPVQEHGEEPAGPAIAEARRACRALRDCDKVCGVRPGANRYRPDPPASCVDRCRGQPSRARRQCHTGCRRIAAIAAATARRTQRRCRAQCRAQYKTPGCQLARQRAVTALHDEGHPCAEPVSLACTVPVVPPSPADDGSGPAPVVHGSTAGSGPTGASPSTPPTTIRPSRLGVSQRGFGDAPPASSDASRTVRPGAP